MTVDDFLGAFTPFGSRLRQPVRARLRRPPIAWPDKTAKRNGVAEDEASVAFDRRAIAAGDGLAQFIAAPQKRPDKLSVDVVYSPLACGRVAPQVFQGVGNQSLNALYVEAD